MDIEKLTITKRGKAIAGKPQKGVYYTIFVPKGEDLHLLRKELAKAYPGAQFNIRFAVATPDSKETA